MNFLTLFLTQKFKTSCKPFMLSWKYFSSCSVLIKISALAARWITISIFFFSWFILFTRKIFVLKNLILGIFFDILLLLKLSITNILYFFFFNKKFTKFDPTLPRVKNIPCPNAECSTNTENTPREIIYIKYNETNLSFMYLCPTCNTSWKI